MFCNFPKVGDDCLVMKTLTIFNVIVIALRRNLLHLYVSKLYKHLTRLLFYIAIFVIKLLKDMENYLVEIFERDLLKLKTELIAFNNEDNIWRKTDGISNSAGTLVLHLLGNLNYTIGALLGGSGYVRNREQEFSLTAVPREKLIADIESTIGAVKNGLQNVDQSKLEETYPLEIVGQKSTIYYLTFFYGHFNYHLGQINYLRRILEA